MDVSGKIWGQTSEIFNQANVSIHRIEGRKGSYCSRHKHEHKYNIFFVESGQLKIQIWKKDYDLIDTTTIGPMQSTTIAPGEFHRFEVIEDCVAFEIYYVQMSDSDIVRSDVGGKKNDEKDIIDSGSK